VAFIRKVPTASGATAVQIAEYARGRQRIVKHVGSAHTEAELGVLMEQARALLEDPAQGVLDLHVEPSSPVVTLLETRDESGVPGPGDRPGRRADLGARHRPGPDRPGPGAPASEKTMRRTLARCVGRGYRDQLATACFTHAGQRGCLAVCCTT
jgi:hypothetical protein